MLKKVIGILVTLVAGSNLYSAELSGDPTNDKPGLHVLSSYGEQYTFVDQSPTEDTIRQTIRNLDWIDRFHQVVLVIYPGVSLEVGGSLNPSDGLSSVYRDLKNRIYRVAKEPPKTVQEMEDILVSFQIGDGKWESMYKYELIPY